MIESTQSKILSLADLLSTVGELKASGKTIVQSHGVFDLIHPGIIHHLQDARKQGDVLVVTIIRDQDVKRGFGQPIFPEKFRAENVAALVIVDFVCIVEDDNPCESVKTIQPDVFAKGKSSGERDRSIDQKVLLRERELYLEKCRIYETVGFTYNSADIINGFLNIFPDDVQHFIRDFRQKYCFSVILKCLNSLKDLKILIIGDGIIDEYCYSETMGKSPKSQLIVNKFLDQEIFAGGVFAIANHVACICDQVHLLSLLGMDNSREDFVREHLLQNVNAAFFYRPDGPTVIKRRYINMYNRQKMFEINYLNDCNISRNLEEEIMSHLKPIITNFDLVLVSDFGHGFITPRIQALLEENAPKLAVNTQVNGGNAGYNLITKYHKTDFICLDTPEARLATQMRHEVIEHVGLKLISQVETENLIITLGSDGAICFSKNGSIIRTPALSTKVIDIIGAGDAFFSYTAPCFVKGLAPEMVSFIGNAVGALAVQIVGNKKPVEKHELLDFIDALYRIRD